MPSFAHAPLDTRAPHPATHPAARSASAAQQRLFIVSEHLRHAELSHAQACSLEQGGQTEQARQQSRMTQVFLHNALHHLGLHSPPAS